MTLCKKRLYLGFGLSPFHYTAPLKMDNQILAISTLQVKYECEMLGISDIKDPALHFAAQVELLKRSDACVFIYDLPWMTHGVMLSEACRYSKPTLLLFPDDRDWSQSVDLSYSQGYIAHQKAMKKWYADIHFYDDCKTGIPSCVQTFLSSPEFIFTCVARGEDVHAHNA